LRPRDPPRAFSRLN